MSREEKIARIVDTFLGFEDHGIFTAILYFDYGNGGRQSTSGYSLGGGSGKNKSNSDFGGHFIRSILNACGTEKWEDLKGRVVIAILEEGLVIGVKPLPVDKGEEFIFKELAAEYKDKP